MYIQKYSAKAHSTISQRTGTDSSSCQRGAAILHLSSCLNTLSLATASQIRASRMSP